MNRWELPTIQVIVNAPLSNGAYFTRIEVANAYSQAKMGVLMVYALRASISHAVEKLNCRQCPHFNHIKLMSKDDSTNRISVVCFPVL